jgi:hypothetical protein
VPAHSTFKEAKEMAKLPKLVVSEVSVPRPDETILAPWLAKLELVEWQDPHPRFNVVGGSYNSEFGRIRRNSILSLLNHAWLWPEEAEAFVASLRSEFAGVKSLKIPSGSFFVGSLLVNDLSSSAIFPKRSSSRQWWLVSSCYSPTTSQQFSPITKPDICSFGAAPLMGSLLRPSRSDFG